MNKSLGAALKRLQPTAANRPGSFVLQVSPVCSVPCALAEIAVSAEALEVIGVQ